MNVYMRAATILNTLERLVGEETMMRIMRTYHMRWRFRHPTTADFIAAVNEIAGRDLTWFFDELLTATHQFDYGVSRLESVEIPKHHLGVFDVAGKKEEMTRKRARDLRTKEKPAQGEKEVKSYLTTVCLRRFGEAGAASDAARANEAQKLLNYGFQAFDTLQVYQSGKPVANLRVWKGTEHEVAAGFVADQYLTLRKGKAEKLALTMAATEPLIAPVTKGQRVGMVKVSLEGKAITEFPLVALGDVPVANIFGRAWDTIRLWLK